MRILAPIVFAAAAFVAPVVYAQEAAQIAAATDAAIQWLALTDAGKPGDSWDKGAPAMRAAVTREKWSEVITAVRTRCITERSPVTNVEMIEMHGKLRLTNCPQHEDTATQQVWRTACD